jgi:hypothetical protein
VRRKGQRNKRGSGEHESAARYGNNVIHATSLLNTVGLVLIDRSGTQYQTQGQDKEMV